MAFDLTATKGWLDLVQGRVTEEELREMGILFGQGPTGFVDRETRQPLDPNNIPLPARSRPPALLDKVGGYVSQLGQYATQAGQDIAEKAGNIWDRIDSEYQKDPDKFIDAVNRFGRSVFEEQNTGVQWGPPGAKVTDWGKHFGAATDVYDPDSQYNMEKRAAQRAEQKDIIALGMAQVESQIQQITLGKSKLELKQLLDKVERGAYHELPTELKAIYNGLVAEGKTPEQAMNIIGEALRKRYDAKTKEIEVGIEKTNAEIAKTMSETDEQKLKNAVAQANKGLGNPESLKDIDKGSVYAAWWAEFNEATGTEEEKKNKAWDVARTILKNREELRTQTQQAKNSKMNQEVENLKNKIATGEKLTDAQQSQLDRSDALILAAGKRVSEEDAKAWAVAYGGTTNTKDIFAGALLKLRNDDTKSVKQAFYEAAQENNYTGKMREARDGKILEYQQDLADIEVETSNRKEKGKSDITALRTQLDAVDKTIDQLRSRIGTYDKVLKALGNLPDDLWSTRKPLIQLASDVASFFRGQNAEWQGDADILEKLTTEMTFDFIDQTKGTITDREMDLFKSAVVSWNGTKGSNITYVTDLKKEAEKKLKYLGRISSILSKRERRRPLDDQEKKDLRKSPDYTEPSLPFPNDDVISDTGGHIPQVKAADGTKTGDVPAIILKPYLEALENPNMPIEFVREAYNDYTEEYPNATNIPEPVRTTKNSTMPSLYLEE